MKLKMRAMALTLVPLFTFSLFASIGPRVPEKLHRTTQHGDVRNDEFFWLREDAVLKGEKPTAAVEKVIRDQNSFTDKMLAQNKVLEGVLKKELTDRLAANAALKPIPYVREGYEYWNQTSAGQIAPIYFRKKIGTSKVETLVDGPTIAGSAKFINIVLGPVSPSGDLVPYMVDLDGDRQGALYVKNLKTGQVRTIRENDVKATDSYWKMAWGSDDQSLYYSVPGSIGRDTKIVRADLSIDVVKEEDVFDETDPDFYLFIKESASKKYIFLYSYGSSFSVFRALNRENPSAPLIEFTDKRKDHKYIVDHVSGKFVIQSNRDGKTKFWTSSDSRPAEKYWQLLETQTEIPEPYETTVFQDYLFFVGYSNAEQHGVVVRLTDGAVRNLPKSDPTVTFTAVDNFDPSAKVVRLKTNSLIQPTSTIEVNLQSLRAKNLSVLKLPGYNPALFSVQRKDFDSTDGTKVPTYIAKQKKLLDVSTPALVSAYGHYGTPTMTVSEFDLVEGIDNYSLLNRGVALVLALPRGVGDLGAAWASEGAYLNKRNTLIDTVAVIQGLSKEKLSEPTKIALRGYSAGGLNVGYVANEAPSSLKAIVGAAPFVDILNTMLDETLPMTTQEFAVWGNPIKNASEYSLIKTYAPYENIRKQNYPAVYAVMSISDSQVPYWEPIKWISRLQKNHTGTSPILLRMFLEGGHTGSVGEAAISARAEEQAFVLKQIDK